MQTDPNQPLGTFDEAYHEILKNYSYLNIFNEDEIQNLNLEILGFRIDSIIKFKSYILASNLLQESLLNNEMKDFVKIFKNNPNMEFSRIKDIIK